MQLRDYQTRAIEAVIAALPRNPCLVAPTGSGKTVMASDLVHRLAHPTLWLAHRRELIGQAANHLAKLFPRVGVILAGEPANAFATVQVASVQSLIRRTKPFAELIVIDEAHHAAASSYGEILDWYPGVPRVGLTATPFRTDGQGLGDLFGELIVASTTEDLCDAGTLHRPRVFCHSSPDLTGVKIVAGEFHQRQTAERINTPDLVGDIVQTWLTKAAGRRTVVFATSVEHSMGLAEQFCAAGVKAEHLDGTTPADWRAAILDRLWSGKTTVVCNCQVLTEGWDLPALECAVIARPTASLGLHLQMLGRVMRACEGKAGAIVLDHAGNHHRHGPVTRRLTYSLEGKVKPEPLGVKLCRGCFLMVAKSAKVCPECGFEFTGEARPPVEAVEGELTEFNDADPAYRQQVWEQIEVEREMAGYAAGWSVFRFEERFGEKPLVIAGKLLDPATATREQKRLYWRHLEQIRVEREFNAGWTAHRYRELFGCWPTGFVTAERNASVVADLNARWAGVRK